MPDFNLDASAALRAKIFSVLTGGKESATSFFSYLTTGIPITPDMLKFLEGEDVYSAEVFAQKANGIPAGVGDWVAGTSKIWGVYKNWIESYDAPPFNPTPEQEKKLEAALLKVDELIEKYLEYKSTFSYAQMNHDLLKFTPKSMQGPDYNKELGKAKIEMDQALQRWNSLGKRDIVENAQATIMELGRKDPARTRKYLTDLLGEPVSIGGASFYPTTLFPSDFWKGTVSWSKFSMSSSEIKQYASNRDIQFGGQGSVDAAVFKMDVDVEGQIIYTETEIDTDDMQIEVEMTRATIIRPWFDPFLMNSQAWKWPNQTPERPEAEYRISDGRMPPLKGTMVMVPTEVVFARNIRVKLKKSSDKNSRFLMDIKGGASFSVGPFKISGNIKWKEEETKMSTKVTEDSVISENMQIIGFFCQITPSAPNPDWNLWPKEVGAVERKEVIQQLA